VPTRREQRFKRTQRLESAKRWVPTHSGRNLVRRYRDRYGVDVVCAILELRMLGVDIPDARLEQERRSKEDRAARRARRRSLASRADDFGDSDETFAFIAGYTEGGAPYGITWEELNESRRDRAAADSEVEDWWLAVSSSPPPPPDEDGDGADDGHPE